ncbi:MAG: hypothetical protein WBP71_19070, partial [Terracidiphilus sp.]
EPVSESGLRLPFGGVSEPGTDVPSSQYGCGQGFRSVPVRATQPLEAAAANRRFFAPPGQLMKCHPSDVCA